MLEGIRVADRSGESGRLAARMLADLGAEATRDVGGADVLVDDGSGEAPGDPRLIRCSITPFGLTGPRAHWRATDLGAHAASGNLYLTGDPDRAPVRCAEPVTHFHGGAEAVVGILLALWDREETGRGQTVDQSLQEAAVLANMGRAGEWSLRPHRGSRSGALMRVGRTTQREIWRCRDGWVSFGLRGGPARIPGLKRLAEWVGSPVLAGRDWDSYNHNLLTQQEVDEISEPIARFLETKTMTELYAAALERGLMLAPAYTAREILASHQSAARGLFAGGPAPQRFAVETPGPLGVPPRAGGPIRVLELGSGAAGPLAMRYLADHGAIVVRVESRTRPDFLRLYGITAEQRSLDASPMFAQMNANKLAVTLNLKHPEGRAIALRLARWADLVAENFAPRTMGRFGLAYTDLVAVNPGIVMVSTCLHGQTGPERDYPGFGGQGSALAGFNHLTGWPDREPLGPYGTITDSLSPRFAAAAALAALWRRRRGGPGAHLDVSQVECGIYCLAPALAGYAATGIAPARRGNDDPSFALHGVFPCDGDDRWLAVACRTDAEAKVFRRAWVQNRDRDVLAERLQAEGIAAVGVADLDDLNRDPQLEHRGHFVPMDHPVIGRHHYEAPGFRLSAHPFAFTRPGPTLGRDNDEVFRGILGLSREEIARLSSAGAFE